LYSDTSIVRIMEIANLAQEFNERRYFASRDNIRAQESRHGSAKGKDAHTP